MTTLAVVLAAGGGRRFGGPKLRAPFRGRPLVSWALDAALGAGLDEVAVVTGGQDLEDLLPPGVVSVPNPRWSEGQATSLQAALAHAQAGRHDAMVVGLGDSPLVGSDAWSAVAAARGPIATATFDGRRRPPVRLDREVWALLPARGDEGARAVMARRPDLVVEVPCAGDPLDVDTEEDLAAWS